MNLSKKRIEFKISTTNATKKICLNLDNFIARVNGVLFFNVENGRSLLARACLCDSVHNPAGRLGPL